VCDRIGLSEIEKVACLGLTTKYGEVDKRKEEADCSATLDDAKRSLSPDQSATKPALQQKPKTFSGALFTKAVHDDIQECVLEVFTQDGGFNDGRVLHMRAANQEEALSWAQAIQNLSHQEAARCKAKNEKTLFEKVQISARSTYEHSIVQIGSAVLVGINFVIMALQYELMPSKDSQEPEVRRAFDAIEYAFTVLFFLELCLNMLAYWFKAFWSDFGNIMDFVVVIISILSIFLEELPGVSLLRLIRIFRVVRVFKKLESLRILVMALASALLPVCNAFFMLFIVAAMYSIVAVMFWSDLEGFHDLFGKFSVALLTMCQVASGDGWVTDVLKPMLKYDLRHDAPIVVFFFSFYLICGIVMLNVVVAVLLDEFINTVSQIKESKNQAVKTARDSVLDPVLAQVVGFTTSRDLTSKICAIFALLDSDNSGSLSYKELAAGLRRLTHKLERPVNITPGDFDAITARVGGGGVPSGAKDEKWLDENGCLNCTNFEMIIRQQLAMYIQRQISFGVQFEGEKDGFSATAAVLQGLKLLIVNGESASLDTASAGTANGSVEGRLRTLESQQEQSCAKQNQISEQLTRISAQLEMSLEISQSILKHGFRIPPFTPLHTCMLPTWPSGVEESSSGPQKWGGVAGHSSRLSTLSEVSFKEPDVTQAAAHPPSSPPSLGPSLASVAPPASVVEQLQPASMSPLHTHSPMPASGSTNSGLNCRLQEFSRSRRREWQEWSGDVQAVVEPTGMQEPAPSLATCMWTHGNAGEGGDKSMFSEQGTGIVLPQTSHWLTQYSTRRPGMQDAGSRCCSPLPQANTPCETLPESPDCITNLEFPSERAVMPVHIPKDS
jgi:hypothetical protein